MRLKVAVTAALQLLCSAVLSAANDCEPCQCTFPATRQGICGRFDIPCSEDPTCIKQWSGPISDAGFCQQRCEKDMECSHFSRWEDNGCRIYSSCADSDFVENDQVTTFEKTCTCAYETHFAGVCGARTESIAFFPPESGRQPGFCAYRCSLDAACRFYSEWDDLGCRIFDACDDPQATPGEGVTSYQKLCAELPACTFTQLPSSGTCGEDAASIASWQDPIDPEAFCSARCKENSDCKFYSVTSSSCRLFDTCDPNALIQEPASKSYRKDCGAAATPAPIPAATAAPIGSTAPPTASPVAHPTEAPTEASAAPSEATTPAPTDAPSSEPSAAPTTAAPTGATAAPTQTSEAPTGSPTAAPSASPSPNPSLAPSSSPNASPSTSPSQHPTGTTAEPSQAPTGAPSFAPSVVQTAEPTASSGSPSGSPTASPSISPNAQPSTAPSASPTSSPADFPTISPSANPSGAPSLAPTETPNAAPTVGTFEPTSSPTRFPQSNPTILPTADPTTLAPTSDSFSAIVFVSKSGRDRSGCGAVQTDACFTLTTGLSQLQFMLTSLNSKDAVGALMVEAGVYAESGLSFGDSVLAAELHVLSIGSGDVVFDAAGRSFFTVTSAMRMVARGVHVRNCETAFEVFGLGTRLELEDVEISHCSNSDGGAVRVLSQASAVIVGSELHKNEAARRGGALYAADKASVIIRDSNVHSNKAGDIGGGLAAVTGSTVTLEAGCNFTSNEASSGGALSMESSSVLSASKLTLVANRAFGGDGGAVYASNANLAMTHVSADSNDAAGNGGVLAGICLGIVREIRLDDFTASGNTALALGGAVYVSGCSLRMHEAAASSCSADSGGAIAVDHAKAVLNRTQLIQNSAGRNGGALFLTDKSSDISCYSATVQNNVATAGNGGGLRGSEASTVQLDAASSLLSNSAPRGGGGGYFLKASTGQGRRLAAPWKIDATIADNSASYGDQTALSAAELCLAVIPGVSCAAIKATTTGNALLRQALVGASPECSSKLSVHTDSFLPGNAVLYYRDRNGEAFILDDAPVAVASDGGDLLGASLLAIGEEVGCLENLKVRAVPGSIVNLTLTPTDPSVDALRVELNMLTCDAREGTVLTSSSSCERCSENTYAADGRRCETCPSDGAVCVNGLALLERGWWGEAGAQPLRCPIRYFCTQRDISNVSSNCREGHTGDFCLSCEAGNYFSGFSSSCEQCPEPALMALAAVVVALAAAFIAGTLVLAALRDEPTDGLVKIHGLEMSQMRCNITVAVIKVLLAHFQLIGLCVFVRVAWQAYMVQFFAFMQAVSLSGLRWAQCLFDSNQDGLSAFYILSIIVFVLPLIAAICALGLNGVMRLLRQARGSKRGVELKHFMLTSMLAAGLLLHVLVLVQGFEFFVCVNVGDLAGLAGASQEDENDASLLLADPQIVCGTSEHASWAFGLGIAGLVGLWGVGFIVMAGVLLYKSREDRDPKVGMLYRSYLPEYYYWDVVVLAFHVCFVAMVVLLQLHSDVQVFAALILLGIWINRHVSGKLNCT